MVTLKVNNKYSCGRGEIGRHSGSAPVPITGVKVRVLPTDLKLTKAPNRNINLKL